MLLKVFEKVKWELPSYPISHHHYFYNFIATCLATKGHQGKAEEYFLVSFICNYWLLQAVSVTLAVNTYFLMCDMTRELELEVNCIL